jgi:hypothetical protein
MEGKGRGGDGKELIEVLDSTDLVESCGFTCHLVFSSVKVERGMFRLGKEKYLFIMPNFLRVRVGGSQFEQNSVRPGKYCEC